MKTSETLLEIRNLKKGYGQLEVLNDISLAVHKGEVVVIVGPSGCGKSTLLRCINGLEPIQSGEILLDGKVITDGSVKWSGIRQKIGMVFQSYDLFPNMTVLQNVILAPMKIQKRPKKEAAEAAEKLLDRVGLLDKKDVYPRQLSGGQKQNKGYTVGIESLGSLDTIAPAVQKGNAELLKWLNDEIVALGKENFFHANYQETLAPVYGDAVDPDSLVVEGGKVD